MSVMKKPNLGEPRLVYEDPYSRIHRIEADFGAFTKEYFVSSEGHRAGVVVLRGVDVLLVRQYRLLIDGYSFEIPGGAVDDGETAQEAATRECYEETGILCATLKPLLTYQLALDTRDNPTHLFYCSEFEDDGPSVQESVGTETSGYSWISFSECLSMIFRGEISDSFSIIALLGYHALQSGHVPAGT
jgi:8-oxo-dGTP pyrophosphatase MutT (NUDIX family)